MIAGAEDQRSGRAAAAQLGIRLQGVMPFAYGPRE